MLGRLDIILAVLLYMVSLVGCGSDSSRVVSSTPANGASNYLLSTTITVTMAIDLDPATVNGSTVTLHALDSFTGRSAVIRGEVNYNVQTRTVSFAPSGHSTLIGGSFTLRLSGLTDTAGNLLPDQVVSFSSARMAQMLTGFGLSWFYPNGEPGGDAYRVVYDSNGIPSRSTSYTGPGPDGVWLTADDQLDNYIDSTVDVAARTVRSVKHSSTGPDGVWFTDDDPVSDYMVVTYGAERDSSVNYGGPGGDGLWFTADDAVSYYGLSTYNADGSTSSDVWYNGAGPDGAWFTSDDVYSSYTTFIYDANGNLARYANSRGAGPDGIPFTADDPAFHYTDPNGGYSPGVLYEAMTYDANNRLVSSASYEDSGPDGVWFTPDDVYRNYSTRLYDPEGRLIRDARTGGAGSDDIPFTADDTRLSYDTQTGSWVLLPGFAVSYTVHSYDAGGNSSRDVTYAYDPGPDGVWFTTDDPVSSYTDYTPDGAGRVARRAYYNNPGPDGTWFTADDTCMHYFGYSYDAGGRVAQSVDYDSGPDGVALTADDRITSYEVTSYGTDGLLTSRSRFAAPGLDAVWFTADDVLSMYHEYRYVP